jgi:glyoxylase-like metal-dependent hydrolase (beta-lactamase superfamily II)
MTKLLRALLASACLSTLVFVPVASRADAPMARSQAPGYYRTMVGEFEVTVLSDGTLKLPVTQLLKGDATKIGDALRRNFLGQEVETSVNGFLVNTGSKLVLIDAGAGTSFGPTTGNLANSLRAAGYRPEQVDEIYITHMHGDHVGGLVNAAGRTYPNATLRIDKRDTDFWLSEEAMTRAPADARGFFKTAMSSVNPYKQAGKLKTFEGPTNLIPGVRAISAYGHTPGHTAYVVESKGEQLVLWGDLIHVAAVQFEDPTVTIGFDSDNAAAEQARQAAFSDAAKGGYWVAGAHLPFPGIGHLRAADKGYVFVPANYSALK